MGVVLEVLGIFEVCPPEYHQQPAKDVLEYPVWTQVKDCELNKDECAIYSRKTKKDPAKKSYSALETIIES